MDEKQFDELIVTIISGFEGINNSIKSLESTIKEGDVGKVDKSTEVSYDDYVGVPLDSMHHPRNPNFISGKTHRWDESVKMWRKK